PGPATDCGSGSQLSKQLDVPEDGDEKWIESADDASLKKQADAIVLVSAHNAYHRGQILDIRKPQGSWDPEKGVKRRRSDRRGDERMATSIDATQRKLIVGIVIATLIAWAIVIADLARGGHPDPPTLRAAATTLDGVWRFQTGDDPHWAHANTNDSGWETIDLTALPGSHDGDVGLPDYVGGWMAHGHPGYTGYAWYRRAVTVPAGHASWDILGPTLVEDGYELYWNGKLLGGSGRFGPDPRVVGTRPLRFAL